MIDMIAAATRMCRRAGRRFWLTGLAALVLLPASPAHAQSVCPGNDDEIAREAVRFFLEERADVAAQAGIPRMDPSGLRPLSDARDGAACQRLRAEIHSPELTQAPWRHAVYELGGYYFEVFYQIAGPDELLLYRTPFRVRDTQLNVLLATLI